MKLLGLLAVLIISIAGGYIYWMGSTFQAQEMPDSYKVKAQLEETGLSSLGNLNLTDIDGNIRSFKDFEGKVVIFSFWATWCEPCVEEFPSFLKLLDAFPEKVILVAISHDYESSDVKQFVEAFDGYRSNLWLSLDAKKEMSGLFGVDRLPEGYVFDTKGKLVKKIIGIQDWASEQAIEYFKAL